MGAVGAKNQILNTKITQNGALCGQFGFFDKKLKIPKNRLNKFFQVSGTRAIMKLK